MSYLETPERPMKHRKKSYLFALVKIVGRRSLIKNQKFKFLFMQKVCY